jgi:hypothetical protein
MYPSPKGHAARQPQLGSNVVVESTFNFSPQTASLVQMISIAITRISTVLGEIDAALRLKSEEVEGLIDLEGNLRRQYVNLFTLSRDDDLTTAELLAPKQAYDDDEEETAAGAEVGDGKNDLDFASQFNSDPKTTTVSFFNASISDFSRNIKQGKVRAAGDDCPEIGVSLVEARIQMVRVCTDNVIDKNLRDRMKDAGSLASYAGNNWAEHLEHADSMCATDDEKLTISTNLARIMYDEMLFPEWARYRNHLYLSDKFARPMLLWLKQSTHSLSTTTSIPLERCSRTCI